MDSPRSDARAYVAERGTSEEETFMSARRTPDHAGAPLAETHAAPQPALPGDELATAASSIEPPSVPDGTFVKVAPSDHPLGRACEVTVYFQDYHRSSSKLGRFGKIVGIDEAGGEYLVMLDNFECLAAPMRRVEWRKVAT
jgi:hypothetical protein